MKFTVHVETEDPRFADRKFQLRDDEGFVEAAFATKESLLEGARGLRRDAQNRVWNLSQERRHAQGEADGLEELIQSLEKGEVKH